MSSVLALAYHICRVLLAAFTQPRAPARLLGQLCAKNDPTCVGLTDNDGSFGKDLLVFSENGLGMTQGSSKFMLRFAFESFLWQCPTTASKCFPLLPSKPPINIARFAWRLHCCEA